jgi:acetoin:2,6-dichlorophenolindophenol oxidoreductase subunit beta
MAHEEVDGQDVRAVYEVASKYVERARSGGGPAFLLLNTYRYHGHHVGDVDARAYYRPKSEEEQEWMTERDPVRLHGEWLMAQGRADKAALDAIQEELVTAEMDAAVEFAVNAPYPRSGQGGPGHLCLRQQCRYDSSASARPFAKPSPKRCAAIRGRADGRGRRRGGHDVQGAEGARRRVRQGRIIDTPISEAGFTGIGVGAAMTGMRPIVDIMFGDFLTLIMDQVVNQAAKIHYMSGGKWKVPLVIRATMGALRRSGSQHSQSLHAWPSHVPGLKVVIPSTPYDAKGLFKAAIRDDNPVVVFEDKISYTKVKGPVPEEEYVIPLGVADVKREGQDITLVATSSMVQVALGAATMLEEVGISAEVVDPRTTWPLDEKTLIDSVKKTSRCIVMDEGYYRYGVTGELAAVIQEGAFYDLDGPVRRLAAMHVPIPFSPPLEDTTVPTERDVVRVGAADVQPVRKWGRESFKEDTPG